MRTTLVHAWVGEDTTGVRVLAAHQPFITVPLPTGDRRMCTGFVAAAADDLDRIQTCDVYSVHGDRWEEPLTIHTGDIREAADAGFCHYYGSLVRYRLTYEGGGSESRYRAEA